MAVLHYRELIAWQKAMDLVVEIYRITSSFPVQDRSWKRRLWSPSDWALSPKTLRQRC